MRALDRGRGHPEALEKDVDSPLQRQKIGFTLHSTTEEQADGVKNRQATVKFCRIEKAADDCQAFGFAGNAAV